jgi:hypothetical protein
MTSIGRWAAAVAIVLAAAVAGAQNRSKGDDCSHSMRGTVKTVDKATGEVSIAVPGIDDEIAIHLPPGEVSGFERGDEVVVSMGLRESRAGSDRPAAK